jgi:hypothetical protein
MIWPSIVVKFAEKTIDVCASQAGLIRQKAIVRGTAMKIELYQSSPGGAAKHKTLDRNSNPLRRFGKKFDRRPN